MGKTRYAILIPVDGVFSDCPKQGDMLLFDYQYTEKVLKVDDQLADNVFLVISGENNLYIVYVKPPDLVERYRHGDKQGLALIGHSQDKMRVGTKAKIQVWDYDKEERAFRDIGRILKHELLYSEDGILLHKVITTLGVYYVMS